MGLRVKRVYDPPEQGDGLRVLVDRLWPRGLTKDEARVDLWVKDLAPTDALRRWYGHAPVRWPEFRDERCNNAMVLRESLTERARTPSRLRSAKPREARSRDRKTQPASKRLERSKNSKRSTASKVSRARRAVRAPASAGRSRARVRLFRREE